MNPASTDAGQSGTFETALIDAIQPIRFHVLAAALFAFLDEGVQSFLRSRGPAASGEIAAGLGLDPRRLESLLYFLRVEGYLTLHESLWRLTTKGTALETFRGWYELLVGGYSQTYAEIGKCLHSGGEFATRDLRRVSIGSCQISHFDAIPLTRRLIARASLHRAVFLDLGCGNAQYLIELCRELPEVTAIGVEPSKPACEDGQRRIARAGLHKRIQLVNSTAESYLSGTTEQIPSCVIFGFVLHELILTTGVDGLEKLLRRIVEKFPDVHLIVIEVALNRELLQEDGHPLIKAYYNPYYLVHAFTPQQLMPEEFWELFFARCGLRVLQREVVDPSVDSTGLEVGYLLRGESR